MLSVAKHHRLITAAEMDGMTPDERAAAIDERIVTSWDDVPSEFRETVIGTAHRLASELGRDQRDA
jgi:hypothetical protein